MSAGTLTPPAEQQTEDPGPQEGVAAAPAPAAPASNASPTQYVVVALIHEDTNPIALPEHADRDLALQAHVPGVPFIIGGHEKPELFESTGGPAAAKKAALAKHPELAACVREPGLSLATWPARSYEFRQVKSEPQPDKLVV